MNKEYNMEELRKELRGAVLKIVEDTWYNRRSVNPIKGQTDLLTEKLFNLFEQKLSKQVTEEEFKKRCCEMMEIDNSTSLTYAGVIDLLENIYESYTLIPKE